MRGSRARVRFAVAAAAVACVVLGARGAPTASSIALTGHGDAMGGSVGAPLALGATSCLVPSQGPDGSQGTADDETLLVTGIGGALVVTAILTPFLSDYSGQFERLSATRALGFGAGPDGNWGTADDVVFLLDRLGSDNGVTSITVGRLEATDVHAPTRLSASSAAVVTRGPDASPNTGDDTVAILTDLGGANSVTYAAAPFVPSRGRCRPVALSPTSFLVASNGPDSAENSADDVTYLFEDAGGGNDRTDLATPRLYPRAPGGPIRISPTRAAVVSAGADGSVGTADDEVLLLDKLGQANQVASIPVPHVNNYGGSRIVPWGDSALLVLTEGADSVEGTADDSVYLVTRLGANEATTEIVVGATDEDRQARPVPLSPTSFAVVTLGPDLNYNSADDRIAIVSDVGGTNTVSTVTVGGLADGATSTPSALSSTALVVTSGGADGLIRSGGDDAVTVVSGIGTAPLVESVPLGGDADDLYGLGFAPAVLGGGRAVALSTGANAVLGTGNDDALLVVEGLPADRGLAAKKVAVKFRAEAPENGEKVSAKGALLLDGLVVFAEQDITISVGNAAQTVPARSFVEKNGNFTYADKTGANGWVTKVVFKSGSGSLSVKGKGVGTGAETTDAASVAFAVEAGDVYFGLVLGGTATAKGITYRAPK